MQWVPPPSRELFSNLEFSLGACTETKEAGRPGAGSLFSRRTCSDAHCHETKIWKSAGRANQRAARPLSATSSPLGLNKLNEMTSVNPRKKDLDKPNLLLACRANGETAGRRREEETAEFMGTKLIQKPSALA